MLDAHALTPIRILPLQSLDPAPVPRTDTMTCAVEGAAAGEMRETTLRFRISGNKISCVCNWSVDKSEPTVDNTFANALLDRPETALLTPETWHTMACDLGAGGFEKRSSSVLIDAALVFWTVEETFDRAMLRHITLLKVSFTGERLRPLISTDRIGCAFRKGEKTNETDIVTFEALAR